MQNAIKETSQSNNKVMRSNHDALGRAKSVVDYLDAHPHVGVIAGSGLMFSGLSAVVLYGCKMMQA